MSEGPKELIERDGRSMQAIAAAAGISYDTVLYAKLRNRWPSQWRTRQGLRRALGLPETVVCATAPAEASDA